MRCNGGRENPVSFVAEEGEEEADIKFFEKLLWVGQSMSYPVSQDSGMKTYSTRYSRRSLISVPYCPRPDRIERGLRILRALRLSLAASAPPRERPQQREFDFALSRSLS